MTAKEVRLSIILVSVLIFATAFIYFSVLFRPETAGTRKFSGFVNLFSEHQAEETQSRQYTKKRVSFRPKRSPPTGIVVDYPKSPYTLIVPSDEALQKQVFVQTLASREEYEQIRHLIRSHFRYSAAADIERFKDRNYPFWYCLDCDGELFHIDGKDASPYDFVKKHDNECSSIMVVDGLDAKPCGDPNCIFSHLPEEYIAQMGD